MLRLRNWARHITIVFAALGVFFSVPHSFGGSRFRRTLRNNPRGRSSDPTRSRNLVPAPTTDTRSIQLSFCFGGHPAVENACSARRR
jgi:hypothetical protein